MTFPPLTGDSARSTALAALLLVGLLPPSLSAAQQRPAGSGPPSDPLVSPGELELADFESYESSVGRTGADGVHRVVLEAREVEWRPWGSDRPSLRANAFVEEGSRPRVPGPLIRVPAGTTVEVTLRNALPRPLMVRGLNARPGPGAPAPNPFVAFGPTVAVPPGGEEVVRFVASTPGTFHYFGRAPAPNDRVPPPFFGGDGADGPFTGVLIVDEPGATPAPDERIMLITQWVHESLPESYEPLRFMINGRSWPATERLQLQVGEEERWRVINASGIHHPMHLHGFHFQVLSRGNAASETVFSPDERRTVVTESLNLGETMRMAWTPTEPGNWLFHCHLMRHMSSQQHPPASLMAGGDMPSDDLSTEMGGLVIGVTVHDPDMTDSRPTVARELTLWTGERAAALGEDPAYGFVLQDGAAPPRADSVEVPGTPIVIERGVTTQVTVHNRLDFPLGVHWHGLELQSRYDGVPDWSGPASTPTPPVAPGDSAVVLLAPPRAGTFMYHVHSEPGHELAQGLYGALIVVEPGRRDLPEEDVLIVLGSFGAERHATPAINGAETPDPVEIGAGIAYRFRFMHISPDDQKTVELSGPDGVVSWTPVAQDGADLPPALVRPENAAFRPDVGETYDFLWTPNTPGDYQLRVTTQFENGPPAFPTGDTPPHLGTWVLRVR